MSTIEVFFRDCLSALKRIVRDSRGDASLDDVKNEAWLIAETSALAGNPFDLASPADQDSIIRKLYSRFVFRMRTCIGFATRLDKDWDLSDEDAGPRLRDTLRAPELSDPSLLLESHETPDHLEVARRHSYSQATAYAICLARWPSTIALALYLCVKLETLNNRIEHSKAWIKYQPSLFDGIEFISLDFTPLQGTPHPPAASAPQDDSQMSWDFLTDDGHVFPIS